jgi:hypothetical protein
MTKAMFVDAASRKHGRACTELDIFLVDNALGVVHWLPSMYVTCDARYSGGAGLAVHAGWPDGDWKACPLCRQVGPRI